MNNLSNYSNNQIKDALFFKDGVRNISFKYDLMDLNDIKIGELDGITGKVSFGEFRTIKRSATFQLNEYLQKEINYFTDQIQPWFILHMPDGGAVEWPLGIFMLESPNRITKDHISTREIGAYDKTLVIEEDKFMNRYFIASGANYVGAIVRILNETGITKVSITSSNFSLSSEREFSIGTKKKEAINDLLQEINYTSIGVDENGYFFSRPYIEPAYRPVTHEYNEEKNSIFHPEYTENLEIAGRANVFIRIAMDLTNEQEYVSQFINDDILSPLSTVNRGRHIVDFEEVDGIANQTVLDDFVKRIAIESTSAYSHLTFDTALIPTHGSAETLYLNIPSVFDTPQLFSETSWDMDLTYDGKMKHEARKVVYL